MKQLIDSFGKIADWLYYVPWYCASLLVFVAALLLLLAVMIDADRK